MALLTSDILLDKAMERYAQQSVIMQLADGRYSPQWEDAPVKGSKIAIRLPMYAKARRGERADPQVLDEREVFLEIPAAFGSDSVLTDRQLAMELNDFTDQVMNPHIDAVSSSIAKAACRTMGLGVSNFVGSPGTIPTTLDVYADAMRLLSQGGTPGGMGQRSYLVNSAMDQLAVKAGRLLFNNPPQISEQYQTNTMTAPGNKGYAIGGQWYEEEALYQHTVGALGADGVTPRVNGAGQSGTSIITDGWNVSVTGILKQGDKVQFAGAAMVHPVLGTTYPGDLQAFTLAQDVDSDSSGNVTLILTEAVEFGTPYANVSALPADNALISVWGKAAADMDTISGLTFTVGIAMHKSSLVYASPNLILPNDVDKLSGRTRSKIMKIGMRVWRASDVMEGDVITRVETLCGHLVGQPRKAVLICSA